MPAMIVGSKARPRAAAIARAAAAVVVGLALLVVALDVVATALTRIDPPARPAGASTPALEVRGPRSYVGPSWMTRERGLWELHLEGEPFDMGFAHARLGYRVLAATDDYMFAEMHRYVPSRVALWAIRLGVRWQYRHLLDFMPRARQLEIAGQAAAFDDHHDDFLPTYHRMVFYHALHDITQGLERSPMLGCSAFTVAGTATTNGHLLVGRNFDFEGPEPFDRDKAVLFFKPAGKIPFASVAWTGLTGVVTGMNAQGIFASVNAARTDDKGAGGVPVEILLREILESATTLDEAIKMVREARVWVPDFYLLADGKSGESAVVERSPTRTEVRRARDTLLLTNHALLPAFATDAENDRLRRYMTSGARYRRLAELVKQHRAGGFDPRRVLEVLRDKGGEGGARVGLGNRNAIDALIATHSVVADATSLTLWVSEGPHLLGRFVGYDLRKELLGEERGSPTDLPPDPVAGSDELRAHLLAVDELKAAQALARRAPQLALEGAERAVGLDERLPEAHRLLGDLLRPSDRERARREYQRFLELQPPYLHDIEEVKGILTAL